LTSAESQSLTSQYAMSNGRGGRRTLPYAFTEHGVAMLSTVLHSDRAVQMSIRIIRAFMRLRALMASQVALARRMEKLEATQKDHGDILSVVIKDIATLEKNVVKRFRQAPAQTRENRLRAYARISVITRAGVTPTRDSSRPSYRKVFRLKSIPS